MIYVWVLIAFAGQMLFHFSCLVYWCLMDFDRFVKYNNVLDEIEKKLPRKCTLTDNQTRATVCVWVQVLSAVHDQYWSTASHIFDSISVLIRFWLWAVGQNQFHVLCSRPAARLEFRLENHTRVCGCFRTQSHIQKMRNYHHHWSGKKSSYNFR